MVQPRGKDKVKRARRTYTLSHITHGTGVYAIVNTVNGRVYVGSALSIG